MKILATDLDRTLLPNGHQAAEPGAIERFNTVTREHEVTVVYVTGRNLALTEAAIREFGVRVPDVLCGDVGTTIRRWDGRSWSSDAGWETHVRGSSPRWDAAGVRKALAELPGLLEQGSEHQNPFKQSYFIEPAQRDSVWGEVTRRVHGQFDEVLVESHDPKAHHGLLDVLPSGATKRTALEFVAQALQADKSEVVFCGDSGNDILPMTAGFRGVVVGNADEQLTAEVRRQLQRDPSLKVYFARGNYTSGVLEGAAHWGLLS
ncbi:MAG: HAD-IIB family hydrolase [Myxococcota bacterium]